MGFTKALYYPTIDIPEEGWLKSAALYWDEIQTIVPSSLQNPYNNRTSQALAESGILQPFSVNPDMRLVEELTETVVKYISEASNFLISPNADENQTRIHTQKLPREFRMHPEKLPYEIRHLIERNIDEDGWFHGSREFGAFYMSLLANKVCENHGLALLTDNPVAANLTEQARLDNKVDMSDDYRFHHYRRHERTTLHFAEGILTNMVVKGIKIAPTNSIEKIINFKNDHRDELGLFKSNITKLVKDINKETSLEAVQQQVSDIYNNEFLPSVHNLEKALTSSQIKWFAETFLKVSLISAGATTFLPAMLGLTVPQALIAGAGISVFASKAMFNQDKSEKIRNNPFSYVLSVQKELNREPILRNVVL
ncbi:MAG: hypothetical protein JNM36_00205 [Chitinophagales bacterium]|nr:hypothetical protein [Chitinophagales bacterium]